MRKLSYRYKKWIAFRAKVGIERRRFANRPGDPHAFRTGILTNKHGTRTVRLVGGVGTPERLCLDGNYTETISFFHDLRLRTRIPARGGFRAPSGRRGTRIGWVRNFRDFTPLRFISAGAALVLASEYDRISRVSGFPPTTVDLHRWDSYVSTTLSRLGFFELLDIPPYENEPPDAPLVKRMVSDSKARGGVAIERIKELFVDIGGQRSVRIDLSSAVTDAVENVVNHAYPDDWPESRLRAPLWWFVGAADPVNRRITLVIYDHGITIPVSLPRKWTLDHLSQVCLALFRLPFRADDPTFDGQAIDAAMVIGATSTGQSNRGRGLAKIKEIIGRCPEGRLRIVSGCGECTYNADGTKIVANHDIPLMGTYVELEASFGQEDES